MSDLSISENLTTVPATKLGTNLSIMFTRQSVIINFCIMMILVVDGLAGNSFLISVILKSPQLLQHNTNILVCNLIATDLGSTLTATLYIPSYQMKVYVFSDNPCEYIILVALSFPVSKISTWAGRVIMVAITIDRYVAIVHPLQYETRFTDKLAKQVVVLSWLIGVATCLVYSMYLVKVDFTSCAPPYSMTMNAVFDIGGYLAIILVMTIAYEKIIKVTREQRSKIEIFNPQSNDSTTTGRFRRELKAVRVFSVILGTYIILWLPYQVGRFLQAFGNTAPSIQIAVDIGLALGSTNYSVGWIIYGLSGRNFRRAIVNILSGKKTDPE